VQPFGTVIDVAREMTAERRRSVDAAILVAVKRNWGINGKRVHCSSGHTIFLGSSSYGVSNAV
jgi:hypothetical protein